MCAARIEDGRSPSSTSVSFNGLLAGVLVDLAEAWIGERVHLTAFEGAQRRYARRGPAPMTMLLTTPSTKPTNAKRLTWWSSQRGQADIEVSSSVFVRIPVDHDVADDGAIRTAMTAGQRGLGVQEQRGSFGHRRSGPSPWRMVPRKLER